MVIINISDSNTTVWKELKKKKKELIVQMLHEAPY